MANLFLTNPKYTEVAFVRGLDVDVDGLRKWLTVETQTAAKKLTVGELSAKLMAAFGGELADPKRAAGPQLSVGDWQLYLRQGADLWGFPVGGRRQRINEIDPERMTSVSRARPKPKPFNRDGSASGGALG